MKTIIVMIMVVLFGCDNEKYNCETLAELTKAELASGAPRARVEWNAKQLKERCGVEVSQ